MNFAGRFRRLAREFLGLFFVSHFEIELSFPFTAHPASFFDLLLKGVFIFINNGLIRKKFRFILINDFKSIVELIHRINHCLVSVIVILLFVSGFFFRFSASFNFKLFKFSYNFI